MFKTNDVNISGGQIHIFPPTTSANSTTPLFCMDAGANPAAGLPVYLQPCSTSSPPLAQQVWSYRTDLSIELVESTQNNGTGLCIDTGSAPTAHNAGDPILLEPCKVADASVCPAGATAGTNGCAISPWNQQWSVDDSSHLEGATTNQTNIDGYCINVAAQTAGTALNLASCAGGVTDTAQTWVLSPTTGTGMAGAGNNQLVNFRQFATCLDVTGQSVSASFMILYNCKQNPDPSKVAWNQKFIPSPALGAGPTKTLLTTTSGGTTYCLHSPGTSGGYPVLSTPCPASVSTASAGFVWTVSQRYTDSTQTTELPYAQKYTIKDDTVTSPAGGLCLGLSPNSDLYDGQYYKGIVTPCDGSTSQKWNADASLGASALTNIHETNGS